MPEIPEGAKKPEDKKPAAEVIADETPEVVEPVEFEWEGATYIVDGDFADDLELLEILGDLGDDENRINLIPKAMRSVLGDEGWDAWKRANRGANGRVKLTDALPFVKALFKELGLGN